MNKQHHPRDFSFILNSSKHNLVRSSFLSTKRSATFSFPTSISIRRVILACSIQALAASTSLSSKKPTHKHLSLSSLSQLHQPSFETSLLVESMIRYKSSKFPSCFWHWPLLPIQQLEDEIHKLGFGARVEL